MKRFLTFLYYVKKSKTNNINLVENLLYKQKTLHREMNIDMQL